MSSDFFSVAEEESHLSMLTLKDESILSQHYLFSDFLQSIRLGYHQVNWEVSIHGKIWRKNK